MPKRFRAGWIAVAGVLGACVAQALAPEPSPSGNGPDGTGRTATRPSLPGEGRFRDRTARAPDGSTIHWYLDRRGAKGRQGILLVLQGSGCASVTGNSNMAVAVTILRPRDAVVVIDKPGVARGDHPDNPMEDCPDEFWSKHTVSRRAADASLVLDAIESEDWWNGHLTLFGGSEGGAVVAMLAARRPEADAAVVFSAGLGWPFAKTLLEALPPQIRETATSRFDEIRRDPDPAKRWGGNSYMWYADILDRDLTLDLMRSRAKILIVQGEKDHPGSARAVQDRFQAGSRCNLIYREYAGLGHQMRDESGESKLETVLRDVEQWLDRNIGRRGKCARA